MIKMKKILLISTLLLVLICVMTSCSHEHQWSEWQVSKAATCTQDGINIRVCDDCGESQSIPVSATGHTWSAWNTTKEASCTQDGLKERTCSCGEKETPTISASGHTFSAWNTTKEATCTVNGSKERSCACGEKETDTIVASHAWKDATCTEAKKCSKCGLTDGSALGHTTQFGNCNRCGNKISATIKCSNNLPQSFTSKYSSGSRGSTTQITDVSFKESGSSVKISVKCKFLNKYATNDAYIAYTITDPNGDIIESWRIWKYQCVSNLVFTETISFTPTMAGEYIITFYDFNY